MWAKMSKFSFSGIILMLWADRAPASETTVIDPWVSINGLLAYQWIRMPKSTWKIYYSHYHSGGHVLEWSFGLY